MEKLWITRFAHISADELEGISENVEDIMILIMVTGLKMAEPIPAFRNLIEACKNNIGYEKSCLEISELLINKSKTIISAMVGYEIKIEIMKQHENTKENELKQVKKARADYKANFECLAKIMNHGSTYTPLTGVKFSKIAEPIEREFGEVASFEALAQLNYDYYSNLGDENIDSPEICNKTSVN